MCGVNAEGHEIKGYHRLNECEYVIFVAYSKERLKFRLICLVRLNTSLFLCSTLLPGTYNDLIENLRVCILRLKSDEVRNSSLPKVERHFILLK